MRVTILTDKKLNFEVHGPNLNFGPDIQISIYLTEVSTPKQKLLEFVQTDLLIVSQTILHKLEAPNDLGGAHIQWLVAMTNENFEQQDMTSTHIANEYIAFKDFNLDTLKKIVEVVLERQQLDRMLSSQQDRFQKLEKLALIGELAASVVHDISTPLTILSSHIEQIKYKTQNNLPLSDVDISKLEKNSSRLINIVKTFRKMINPMDSNPLELLNLNDTLNEMVDLIQSNLATKGIDFKCCNKEAKNLQIEGRRQELIQALLNVVLNSIEAISNLSTKWIRIEMSEQIDNVTISVIDSGGGIPTSVAKKMFDPLKSGKSKSSNLGMGLPIVKRVMQNHGGRLQVDTSSTNTKIDLILPKKQKAICHHNANLNFLVVDDQEDLALLINDELLSRGYKSRVATSYKDALVQIKATHPNVIIADVFMPAGTGLDIYKWVKTNCPQTIVFFITGHQLPFSEITSQISPCDIYVKPFIPAELTDSILNRVFDLSPSLANN